MNRVLWLLPLLLCGCTRTEAQRRGCTDHYRPPHVEQMQAELNMAEQRWEKAQIQNYRYINQSNYSLESSSRKEIRIKGGQGQGTMEQLFFKLQNQVDEASTSKSCLMVEAQFDAKDGHILSVYAQNTQQSVMDAFGGYTIEHFQRY